MKSITLAFLVLLYSAVAAQQGQFSFGLYFGNDFKSDSVTIFINGSQVVNNISLRTRLMDPTNLMIDQDEKNLKVSPYDKPTRHLKKIKIADSILTVDMCMNNSWKRFVINLTKGKYLYAGYRYFRTGWTYRKILIIEQLDFPPLII